MALSYRSKSEIRSRYGRYFAEAQALLDLAWEIRPSFGLVQRMEYRAVLFAVRRRSVDSFEGMLELSQLGLGKQALMMTRSLFEDLISALYLMTEETRDDAVRAIGDQDDFRRLLEHDAQTAHLKKQQPPHDLDALEARRKEFQRRFGTYGQKTWVGDLYTAIGAVSGTWERLGGEADGLKAYYATVHRSANFATHTSAQAVIDVLYQIDDRTSYDDIDLRSAMRVGVRVFTATIRAVAEEVGTDCSQLESQRDVTLQALDRGSSLGRNDLCWCGSGKKFKNCHGASLSS